jgi:hypothetical protein
MPRFVLSTRGPQTLSAWVSSQTSLPRDAETACGEGRRIPALRLLLVWFVPALRAHQRRPLKYLEAEVAVLDTDYHPISGVE